MKPSRALFLILALTGLLQAHVGSADLYLDAQAGPYQLFITVRPPNVIPGVAQLEVRAKTPGIQEMTAVPIPLSGPGAKYAPVADKLRVSAQDPQFFTGSLWLMTTGSWQVRIAARGANGSGTVAVPVPAIALRTKPMQFGLAAALFALMCLLIAGIVLLVGASVREAKLPEGVEPSAENRRRAQIAMSLALTVVLAIVAFGYRWWRASEASYQTKVYKPLGMTASVTPAGTLLLHLTNPKWMNEPFRKVSQGGPAMFIRSIDDLVPDHDHLMHLYAVRQPGMDAVYHLHPEIAGTGTFRLNLPTMKAGNYKLYGDVVHENGFAETMVSQVAIPEALPKRPLSGDDAEGSAAPWSPATENARFTLPDGYTMEWLRPSGALHAKTGMPFRFRLVDKEGRPATGMQFYMGMLGHAAFLKTDGSTFAHVHPTGSVPMASYMMAQSQLGQHHMAASMDMAGMEMPGMDMAANLPNEVLFPYGFPTPGQYRIFVQMKHSGTVETGTFDALVVQ